MRSKPPTGASEMKSQVESTRKYLDELVAVGLQKGVVNACGIFFAGAVKFFSHSTDKH